jgi:hypothetical protein
MVIELREAFEALLTRLAAGCIGVISRIAFERICKIFQMHADKVNEAIAFTNIFIGASLTRTLEG